VAQHGFCRPVRSAFHLQQLPEVLSARKLSAQQCHRRRSHPFTFSNLAQHAKVQEAEADALKAKEQAEASRNQASEETLRLQRTVTQMQAAHDVAELEYEIAQKNVEAVETRMKSGSANLHDLDNARSQSSEK